MDLYSLNAPQLGEGVKDIEVISFLKAPGERVKKDEPLVLVETEKATMEIESPVSGIVHEYIASLRSKVQVGKGLITIDVSKATMPMPSRMSFEPNMPDKIGLQIPFKKISSPRNTGTFYEESRSSVSPQQEALIRAMRGSENKIIPASIQSTINAEIIQDIRKYIRSRLSAGCIVPSSTEVISWAVLEAMKNAPSFCSTMLEDDRTIQRFKSPSIGIAVSQAEDDLATVKMSADEYSTFDEFTALCRQRILATKSGANHNGIHSLSVSDMTALNVQSAVPVIVSPASATLVIGKSSDETSRTKFVATLAFDHRIINGAGAAKFLASIDGAAKKLKQSICIFN